MEKIIQGTTKKPISAQRLVDFFSNYNDSDGILYIGYPIIGTSEGPFPIDALFVSKNKGVVIFNLVEGRDLSNFQENQDDSYNKLESKLKAHKTLVRGRKLQVPIKTVTFAPIADIKPDLDDNYPVCNEENLGSWLQTCSWDESGYFKDLVAVIQSISTIRKGRKKRVISKKDSRGAILQYLEDSIANLDNLQGRAVIETVEGVQRIRGLAGSGKTIVLALKAAYLHAQHSDWKIAVTFNTRSLKGQFRRLINTFTIEQTNEEPDWDNIHIIHAWGAPGGGERSGIYYNYCKAYGVGYLDFGQASMQFGRKMAFKGACEKALEDASQNDSGNVHNSLESYDAILIDEAQDFPPAFLKICYEMLTKEKRLVYAYDELQNLNSQPLPSPDEIFGKNKDGSSKVIFSSNLAMRNKQDIILEKCYRNSRPVLVTAHALGFGIYRDIGNSEKTPLVQIFEHNNLWLDIGYQVIDGHLESGKMVTLARNEDSSPAFLENHSHIDDLVIFKCFSSKEEQSQWVVSEIRKNLKEDEIRPDDIVVINPNPLTTREEVGIIRTGLFTQQINSHLAGVSTSPDVFFDENSESVTFTGIHRAKGNEAGMVYIINAQDCYGIDAKKRNQLFTAITRSKAWVRILGYGKKMELLMKEFEQVRRNEFKLRFKYPTEEEKKYLNLVNRDMTEGEKAEIKQRVTELRLLLQGLEENKYCIEDLGMEEVERLKSFINKDEF